MSFPVWETADQWIKRIVGSWEPEVTWFKMETADHWEKKDRGLKGKENRGENAGSKVQSPIFGRGVVLWKQQELKKNKWYFINLFLQITECFPECSLMFIPKWPEKLPASEVIIRVFLLIIRVFLFDEFLFDNMSMSSDKDNNVAGPSGLARRGAFDFHRRARRQWWDLSRGPELKFKPYSTAWGLWFPPKS